MFKAGIQYNQNSQLFGKQNSTYSHGSYPNDSKNRILSTREKGEEFQFDVLINQVETTTVVLEDECKFFRANIAKKSNNQINNKRFILNELVLHIHFREAWPAFFVVSIHQGLIW